MNDMLKSNRYRYLHGGLILPAIFTSVLTAFLSLVATKLISKYALDLPIESFDALYANGYYNFGLLKVVNVHDLANLTIEQVISSAFIGGFLALILAIFIPRFICGSFKGGFVQNAFIKGKPKITILLSYVISSFEIFVAVFIAYIVSLLIFSNVIMGVSIDGGSLLNCMAIFIRELLAHFVFLSVCISSAFLVGKTATSTISLIFSVIAFPGLLATADLILQRDFSLSSLWIVNIIGMWSTTDITNFAFTALVALLTLVISMGTALIMFVYSDLRQ